MKRPRQLPADELFSYAVRKLSGRAATVGEIRTSLVERALDPGEVDAVLQRLKDYGYLNDAQFAESFAAARLQNEGFGASRVLRDLRQRRVAPDVAERTIASVYAGQDEVGMIERFIRRKYRSTEREGLFQGDKELAGAYRRLIRAGFTSPNSIRVLKRFAANPDLLDSLEPEEPDVE